jgi:hypothetical protein
MGLLDITGISSVLDFGSKIIDRVWPDPAQAAAAKLELFKAQQAGEFKEMDQAFELAKAQIGVNQAEAGNGSVFVSGWRPAIGWVCAAALGYQYLLRPLVSWGVLAAGHSLPAMPGLDENLWQLMMGMLGLGGLRTFEKVKGASK